MTNHQDGNNYKRDFSNDELNAELKKTQKEAEGILRDEAQAKTFVAKLLMKLKDLPGLGPYAERIAVLCDLAVDYAAGRYKDVPWVSMVAIMGALIYIFNPLDMVPDALPVIGVLDDGAVLGLVLNMVGGDVNRYREWRKKAGQ